MFSRKQKYFFFKLFSLFSIVRGYNILIIIIAQYLTSIYILAPQLSIKEILFDFNLFMIVLASATAIASGYIINNFYDSEKDLINRPNKSILDRLVGRRTKLNFYFILNFLSLVSALFVSYKAALFFFLFIFGIWFYSHKLKKYPFIGNLVAATLAVIPLFAVFIYYKNFDLVIFVHATFLFIIISMRELVKDLENLKGDLLQKYHTIPVIYGSLVSKKILTFLSILALLPTYLLIVKFDIGAMDFYFLGSIIALLIFVILLWKSNKKLHYLVLHNILKFIVVIGVFCIFLINANRISF
ncbi:geranylgeranylglycerol-phosphate geranylgeranyltransferase [Flavobacteriaceae bacterium]|jgi:4-hydroxybenzoate polyprenyltransferase|nr:geranylgeranylglycerol-phosphate geranylgeranyltransferase [Flavobacteriaceae bacterium]